MRNHLIVFFLLPIGALLWPSLVTTSECDPASSRGTCSGTGISVAMGEELPHVQARRETHRASAQSLSSRNWLQMSLVQAGLPGDHFANRAVPYRHSRLQSVVVDANEGSDKVSPVSPSLERASQPGSGAMLIAGLLGMCAVARRRISSILG